MEELTLVGGGDCPLGDGEEGRQNSADAGWQVSSAEKKRLKRRVVRKEKERVQREKAQSAGAGTSSGADASGGDGSSTRGAQPPSVKVAPASATEARGGEGSRVSGPGWRGPKGKRKQPDGTPVNQGLVAKRQKAVSFREAAEKALQVGVVLSEGEGRLSVSQGSYLRYTLIDALDETQGTAPRFNESGLKDGAFMVSCADQFSLDWLKALVPKMAFEGNTFAAVPADQLKKRTKMRVFIPGTVSPVERVFSRLQKQNPGLRTDRWRLFDQKSVGESAGQTLILGIDDESMAALGRVNNKPYFELSRLTFEQLGGRKAGK